MLSQMLMLPDHAPYCLPRLSRLSPVALMGLGDHGELQANDFGSEVIPGAQAMGKHIQAYLFDGYWEDIGTIEAFYSSNLALTDHPNPAFRYAWQAPWANVSWPTKIHPHLPHDRLKQGDHVIIWGANLVQSCLAAAVVLHHHLDGLWSSFNPFDSWHL